jgi:hypothetical protein
MVPNCDNNEKRLFWMVYLFMATLLTGQTGSMIWIVAKPLTYRIYVAAPIR